MPRAQVAAVVSEGEEAVGLVAVAAGADEADLVKRLASGDKTAFGTLVETGWISPGSKLTDKKRRLKATVRADGSLVSGKENGSIHRLGAALEGAPSCNGWTFWHIEHEGEMKPIDALRQLYLLATEP